MKFLLDENLGKQVAQFLQQSGHLVLRVKQISPGAEDAQVLTLATSKGAILLTSDKDFGELIFKYGQPHRGIILLRLPNQRSANKIEALKEIFSKHKDIRGFMVVTEKDGKFRIKKK